MYNKSNKEYTICFAASSGGHFEQLMMLKPLMNEFSSFVVTEKTSYINTSSTEVYYLSQVNRKEKRFVFLMILNMMKSLYIYFKKKPDVVVTTGVLGIIPLSLLCKLFRKKVIYIESFAKIDSPTLTGKLLYKFADRFYVQWEPMLEHYPNAVYLGGIY